MSITHKRAQIHTHTHTNPHVNSMQLFYQLQMVHRDLMLAKLSGEETRIERSQLREGHTHCKWGFRRQTQCTLHTKLNFVVKSLLQLAILRRKAIKKSYQTIQYCFWLRVVYTQYIHKQPQHDSMFILVSNYCKMNVMIWWTDLDRIEKHVDMLSYSFFGDI